MLIKYIVYISENARENHTRTITIVRALAEQENLETTRTIQVFGTSCVLATTFSTGQVSEQLLHELTLYLLYHIVKPV